MRHYPPSPSSHLHSRSCFHVYIYIYICSSSRHSSNSHVGFACELKRVPELRLRRHGGRGGGGERGKGVEARSNEAATAQLTPNLESRSFLRRGYIVNDSVVSHVFFPPLVLSSRDKTRRASLEGGSRAIVISPTVPPQRDCCRLSSLSLSLSVPVVIVPFWNPFATTWCDC